jgi:hypothetical protein
VHLFWQADDQLIGMVDHFAWLSVGNSAADLDRIPMFFVDVIAGLDLIILIAQRER